MAQGQDRVKGDYSDFWAKRDLMTYIKPFKAAVLMAHGFNDWNVMPSHSIRFIKPLRDKGVPVQVYFHQGGHGGEPPFSMMNRWFTRYLFGVQNGVEKDPKAWIVRENANRQNPTPYTDYPNPEAKPVDFFLTAGTLTFGNLVLKKTRGEGKETLTDDYTISGSALAQAQNNDHRLLFLSQVLKDSIHISGVTTVKIRASSDKPAVNLSVWLVEMPWTTGSGTKPTDNIITRGWADLQNYKSLTKSEPLKPGRFYDMTFDLEPDDQVIPAGKRIGLMIFSSDSEFTLQPAPGTKLTVDLDGTSLKIPVVGGEKAIR
jgi:X-Pro dipeptidyl-peptidase